MRFYVTLLLLSAMTGCAVTGQITPAATSKSAFADSVYSGEQNVYHDQAISGEEFRVYKQGATGASSPLSIREEIERTASDFCKAKGKALRLLRQIASTPPYLFGNFPKVELVFECVQSQQVPSGGSKPEGMSSNSDKYNDLSRLKKLFDENVISQKEFQREKDKILSKP
jgi:hypothetical protein